MTARTPQLALFDDEPARLDGRTPEQREADLAQIRAEIRQTREGVSGRRLDEITEHWRDDVEELQRRGQHFALDFIDDRFVIVRVTG